MMKRTIPRLVFATVLILAGAHQSQAEPKKPDGSMESACLLKCIKGPDKLADDCAKACVKKFCDKKGENCRLQAPPGE